ncbi:MAG: phosphoribosylglycinamide formyltransferase [Smithella sp.]|jgi:phosphoribosylglycinamide formyltransferase-1|nr:phosphoribosylglycinamide formyltransferase [Smithella sp.]
MADLLKLGVLISGNGSNLQSIIDHIEKGSLRAIIKIVISNNPDAYGAIRAKKHGIPVVILKHTDFKNKEDFDLELIKILKSNQVDLVILAGFMRILTPAFLKAFSHKIMNIHPALLPSFPGIHGQKQAVEYGVKISGCTVHFVDEGVDTGPIIIQSAVQVLDDDTEETLAARILKKEHMIYPQAIQLFADGKIEIKGRKVLIKNVRFNCHR